MTGSVCWQDWCSTLSCRGYLLRCHVLRTMLPISKSKSTSMSLSACSAVRDILRFEFCAETSFQADILGSKISGRDSWHRSQLLLPFTFLNTAHWVFSQASRTRKTVIYCSMLEYLLLCDMVPGGLIFNLVTDHDVALLTWLTRWQGTYRHDLREAWILMLIQVRLMVIVTSGA